MCLYSVVHLTFCVCHLFQERDIIVDLIRGVKCVEARTHFLRFLRNRSSSWKCQAVVKPAGRLLCSMSHVQCVMKPLMVVLRITQARDLLVARDRRIRVSLSIVQVCFAVIHTRTGVHFAGVSSPTPPHCCSKKLSYRRDSARRRSFRRSRSFSVTDFGYKRKPICNLLLMNNTNLHPISHRFQVIADYWSNLRFWTRGNSL